MDVSAIRSKIRNYDYLKSLILKNIKSNDSYQYPGEWSQLMNDILKLCRSGESNLLTYEDFRLFTDGTIAKLFKESLSREGIVDAYETDKLSNLSHLPKEILVILFSQEDMIEALELADSLAIDHICMSNPEISTIISSGLLSRADKTDIALDAAKYELKQAEFKYEEEENRLNDLFYGNRIDREQYHKLRTAAYTKYRESYDKVIPLESSKNRCERYAKKAVDFAANYYRRQATEQFKRTQYMSDTSVIQIR